MADVVVTVPAQRWTEWVSEGNLPGEPATDTDYFFRLGTRPSITPGERVYVVSSGLLRGYAPLIRVDRPDPNGPVYLVRRGGAVAVTIPERIRGFRGYRYRFWDCAEEVPFPHWREVHTA